MSNNTTTNAGSGGDTFTALDISTFSAYPTTGKLPASVIYVGSSTSAAPTPLSNANPLPVSLQNSSIAVTASSLPLPTGAATSANQSTSNTSLASIDGKITTCNTGAVVVSSGNISADTELTTADLDTGAGSDVRAVVGIVLAESGGGLLVGSAHPLPVSGTVTANQGGSWSVTIGAGTAVIGHVIVDSGTVTVGNATLSVTQSGTWTVATNADTAIGGTAAPSNGLLVLGKTADVTPAYDALPLAAGGGSVVVSAPSLPLPTGASTAANQSTGNTSLASIDGKITACNTGAVVISSGSVTADTELTTADLDTGAGTDTRAVVGLVLAESGGGLLVGSAHPLPISDNGGSLTVDGAVTATQGTAAALAGAWPVIVTDGAGQMPIGDSSANTIHTTMDNAALPPASAGTAVIGGTVPSATTGSAPVGATPFCILNAANTTPIQIKGTGGTSSAGTLWDLIGMQVGTSAPIYAKFYDSAVSPTVGTDTPKYTLPLPSAGSANGAGASKNFPVGLKFSNGIWVSFTTGITLLDNTAGAAGQALLSGSYV